MQVVCYLPSEILESTELQEGYSTGVSHTESSLFSLVRVLEPEIVVANLATVRVSCLTSPVDDDSQERAMAQDRFLTDTIEQVYQKTHTIKEKLPCMTVVDPVQVSHSSEHAEGQQMAIKVCCCEPSAGMVHAECITLLFRGDASRTRSSSLS